jgi:hypothetical protein
VVHIEAELIDMAAAAISGDSSIAKVDGGRPAIDALRWICDSTTRASRNFSRPR